VVEVCVSVHLSYESCGDGGGLRQEAISSSNSSHESLPGEVGCSCSKKLGGGHTPTARMATDAEQEYLMVWRRRIRNRNFFTW
jgi:hypothetical protein